jgi:hypothetical protein
MRAWMEFIWLKNIPIASFCEHTVRKFPFKVSLRAVDLNTELSKTLNEGNFTSRLVTWDH